MEQSLQVLEWQAQAKADYLLRALGKRFPPGVTPDLERAVRQTNGVPSESWPSSAERRPQTDKQNQTLPRPAEKPGALKEETKELRWRLRPGACFLRRLLTPHGRAIFFRKSMWNSFNGRLSLGFL